MYMVKILEDVVPVEWMTFKDICDEYGISTPVNIIDTLFIDKTNKSIGVFNATSDGDWFFCPLNTSYQMLCVTKPTTELFKVMDTDHVIVLSNNENIRDVNIKLDG